MKIVTFNIRCSWNTDGINSFLHRAGAILKKIEEEKPDIISFQEIRENIYDFMSGYMKDYIFIGHGRKENFDGEGVYIAFRKDSVKLINFDTFWLSETPDIPASRYPIQSECPRTCVDALFMVENRLVRVVDVHLDHISDEARILGIKQIVAKLEEDLKRYQSRIVMLGDFNARPDSETVKYCDECGYIDVTKGIPVTFHAYGNRKMKIDYIYVDKLSASEAKNVRVWDDVTDGIYLSDHYPVSFEM